MIVRLLTIRIARSLFALLRSAILTEDQVKWVNTQKLLLRLTPDKVVIFEPLPDTPKRQWCFRLCHDEEALGRPTNAPRHARYFGKSFDRIVRTAIILNVTVLGLWSDPIDPAMLVAYETFNYLFTFLFALEAAIKVTAFTFKEYIHNPWNVFDFGLAVFTSLASVARLLAQYAAGLDVQGEPAMRWLRCGMALRILRLAAVSPSLLKMMRTIVFASPSIANITTGIFLFQSAYAQFGMAFLGTLVYDDNGAGLSRHANFETAFRAFSTLVRMSTGDSWSALLADAVHNPHVPGIVPPMPATVYFFFIFYMAFMQWVLISIFVAIILEYFNDLNAEEGTAITFEDVESFQRKWLEFDVNSTSYIKTVDLGLLLYACKPPLVGVYAPKEDGGFFNDTHELVRPTVNQLEQLLVELDVPEHDGYVHFLEVILALLQRLTGVINEEQIMSKLLQLHPGYVPSIKKMPAITGSTADSYVKDEIMTHLRRGLEATGLSEDTQSFKRQKAMNRSFTRSFTRRRRDANDQEERKQRAEERRRASLSNVAASNMLERAAISEINAKQEEGSMNRKTLAAASMVAFIAGGSSSFKKKSASSFTRGRGSSDSSFSSNADDPLAC